LKYKLLPSMNMATRSVRFCIATLWHDLRHKMKTRRGISQAGWV
jgi:hypothetical protein